MKCFSTRELINVPASRVSRYKLLTNGRYCSNLNLIWHQQRLHCSLDCMMTRTPWKWLLPGHSLNSQVHRLQMHADTHRFKRCQRGNTKSRRHTHTHTYTTVTTTRHRLGQDKNAN